MNACSEHLHFAGIKNAIVIDLGGRMVCVGIRQVGVFHGRVVNNVCSRCRLMRYAVSRSPFLGCRGAIDVAMPFKDAVRANLGTCRTPCLSKAHVFIACIGSTITCCITLTVIAFGTMIKGEFSCRSQQNARHSSQDDDFADSTATGLLCFLGGRSLILKILSILKLRLVKCSHDVFCFFKFIICCCLF